MVRISSIRSTEYIHLTLIHRPLRPIRITLALDDPIELVWILVQQNKIFIHQSPPARSAMAPKRFQRDQQKLCGSPNFAVIGIAVVGDEFRVKMVHFLKRIGLVIFGIVIFHQRLIETAHFGFMQGT